MHALYIAYTMLRKFLVSNVSSNLRNYLVAAMSDPSPLVYYALSYVVML